MKKTVCLNMIVKDEEDSIERCIDSVAPYIDSWVIVDTGSKDKTIEKIHEVMGKHGIPGTLYERPWVNFAHNRTEALNLAKDVCDYRFMMDADDYLVVDEGKNPFSVLDSDAGYSIKLKFADIEYYRFFLFKSDLDWRFEGVLHEYPALPDNTPKSGGNLNDCHIMANISPLKRAKSVKEKYAKDAKILEKALKDEPGNPRYQFYLAQSYRDSSQTNKAIEAYKKRAAMGGWDEEVYISLYHVALLMDQVGRKEEDVFYAYSRAWEFRPHRLEAVYYLMRYLRMNKRYVLAFTYGNMAAQNAREGDVLFVNVPIKKWLFVDEYCMSAYYVGQYQLAYDNAKTFMESEHFKEVPAEEQERLRNNFAFYEEAINKNKNEQKDN
jgi:glycosyltransferase involved in cell wall biosynthesis